VNGNARLLKYLVVATVATFGMLVLLAGCQKDKPTAGTQAAQTKARETTPAPMKHEPAAMPMKQEAAPAPATQVAKTGEQTVCPVTGDPIDKNVFFEYQGKKVYFCCASCLDTFKANPEKYISKLPQFAK
jgi:YHS domain-containing protein